MIPRSDAPNGQLPYGLENLTSIGGVPFGQAANNNNQFMSYQSVLPYMQNLPGYANMVGQRSQNTQAMLQGQIPDDVITQISQQAAERGIAGGVPQSPNANAAYLRALGLTSLDLMGQGSQQLSQSIADTPTPELFNPASLWAPEYQQQTALNQTVAAKGVADLQAKNKAASDAWNKNKNYTTYSNYMGIGGSMGAGHL